MNKRGVSGVITAIILIALVLALIGIIWVSIRGLVEDKKDEISVATSGIILETVSAKIDYLQNPPVLNLRIKRNSKEGEVTKVKVIISDDDSTQTETKEIELDTLEETSFPIQLDEDIEYVKKISLAPIIIIDSKEKQSEPTDTYKTSEQDGRAYKITEIDCSNGIISGNVKNSGSWLVLSFINSTSTLSGVPGESYIQLPSGDFRVNLTNFRNDPSKDELQCDEMIDPDYLWLGFWDKNNNEYVETACPSNFAGNCEQYQEWGIQFQFIHLQCGGTTMKQFCNLTKQ